MINEIVKPSTAYIGLDMCAWVSLCIKPAENTVAYSSAAQYNSVLFGANNTAQSI